MGVHFLCFYGCMRPEADRLLTLLVTTATLSTSATLQAVRDMTSSDIPAQLASECSSDLVCIIRSVAVAGTT